LNTVYITYRQCGNCWGWGFP